MYIERPWLVSLACVFIAWQIMKIFDAGYGLIVVVCVPVFVIAYIICLSTNQRFDQDIKEQIKQFEEQHKDEYNPYAGDPMKKFSCFYDGGDYDDCDD